jgi:endonuclease/exonuclease/phosphatase family metal-dependent hydrolase
MRLATSLPSFLLHILCAATLGSSLATTALGGRVEAVTFTTFNIRWFGLGGAPGGTDDDEVRATTIKAHMDRENLWADVIAFEEIVDVAALEEMIGDSYLCHSYSSADPKHQHVVLCHLRSLRFDKAADDDNYTLEDVAQGRLRPAVHGILKTSSGRSLAHLIAVHLKAMPDESEIRSEQITSIARYLKNGQRGQDRDLPVLLMGDFNSFGSDTANFEEIFANEDLDITDVEVPAAYTYRVPERGSKLDHFFLSASAEVMEEPVVAGPCNVPPSDRSRIVKFNNEVSDHCPVRIKIQF